MGHDVFICHSGRDWTIANAVVAMLEQGGVRCWVAPRDILPGEKWATSILRAIEGCRLMVVVFSANANRSEHIRREVERAVHRGIPIAPVRIQNVAPLDDLEYFLSASHWLDAMTPPFEKHLKELTLKVRQLLEMNPTGPDCPVADANPVMPESSPWTPRWRSRRFFAAALLVTVASVAVLEGAYWLEMSRVPLPANPVARAPTVTTPMTVPPPMTVPAPVALPAPASVAAAPATALVPEPCYPGTDIRVGDTATIAQILREAAAGDPGRMYHAGWLFQNGFGVPRDYGEAMKWYLKASDAGYAWASARIGILYQDGLGVKRDYSQAIMWFRKGADAGSALALNQGGWLYENGLGVTRDYAEALAWYRRAADAGNGEAMYNVGLLLQMGRGAPQDRASARRWMQSAAAVGCEIAKRWLLSNAAPPPAP